MDLASEILDLGRRAKAASRELARLSTAQKGAGLLAMADALGVHGNPSSVHAEGRAARSIVDGARHAVAAMVGCEPRDVVFTSGGTEALNMALSGGLGRDGRHPARLLASAGEHPAVLGGHRFADVSLVPLHADGRLDLDALERLVTGEPVLLAIQAANNETGVVQPVAAAARIVRAAGGLVVCDAVQAVGKLACDFTTLDADVLAVSAHKFGGPKGVGALCFRDGGAHLDCGIVRGGGQERGLRAGTENIVGIAGLGAACAPAEADRRARGVTLAMWRDRIEAVVRAANPAAVVFGSGAERLANTTSFAMPGFDAQVLLMGLDLAGIAVSAGSACSAGTVKPSHVLAAMGVEPGLATRAVRVSLGWTTTGRDVDAFAAAFAATVGRMKPRIAA